MESEQKKPAARRLVKLFFSMLYISAFTFGGGFVIVTLMKRKFVDELHWMTEEEMLDIAAMAQSSPGAIAVNAANLVGWRVGGFAGMLTSVIATIIPPMAILTVISIFYAAFASNPYVSQALRGMQAGVAAVIFSVVLRMAFAFVKEKRWPSIALMAAALAACIAHGKPLAECARKAAGAGALACTAAETIHPGMSWENVDYILDNTGMSKKA